MSNDYLFKKTRNKGKSILIKPNEYIVVDIETTGLDPDWNDIIEIGAIKIKDNEIIDKFSTLIKIDDELDEFIIELTGITNEMLNKFGKTINNALSEFVNFIGNNILIGHNVNFDINFLYDKIKENLDIEMQNDYVDTLRLSRYMINDLNNYKLKTLIKYFNIKYDTLHRALDDCLLTNEIYKKLVELIYIKYKDYDVFLSEHKKHKLHASDIKVTNDEYDEDNILFKKNVVFTGTLEKMNRKDAMQHVVNIGGYVQDNINKETNFLVVGKFDYCQIKGNKSNKIKKAENMILKDKDIKILSENVFYDLIK